MSRKMWALALGAPVALAIAAGCGDDQVFAPGGGDNAYDGGSAADGGSVVPPGTDAGTASGCGNASGAPPRVLLSANSIGAGMATSELVALNLQTRAVDGVLDYGAAFGTTWSVGSDPYLLEQEKDVVARLDAREPWKIVSSWNVAGDDATDGGSTYADPAAIAVPACGKGYVVRFKRNKIAVIDTTQKVDAGAPSSWIDLSSQLQPNDHDGLVDATSALWVPSKKMLYVLLGNIDITTVATDGYTALCTANKPAIVGIDVTTDQIVSLGGSGPGGSILLDGYNPPLGASFVYDAALDRLLVLEGGCNADAGGGVAGAVERRRVEEVQLSTGQVRTLLSLDGQGFPLGFAFQDGTRAAIGFYGQAFLWNPQETTLGPEIPGGLDALSTDGNGNVVGARVSYLGDGGRGPIEVVSVPFTDAGTLDAASITTLAKDPFSDNSGFVGGAEVWPHP
jgi:hypothetical protein